MRDIEAWIEEAATSRGIAFHRLSEGDGLAVLKAVEDRFVVGSPRVWWLGFKKPYASFDSDTTNLSLVLPRPNGQVLLIPETDDNEQLPVYRIDAAYIETLIDGCPLFEYYVTDASNEWLVAETDHNVFIVCHAAHS